VRRHAVLALCVWIAAIATIVLFTIFWRVGYVGPHALWGVLSLAAIVVPLLWLAASALWRCVRGPGRLRAIGWLLLGATPPVWIGAHVAYLLTAAHAKAPLVIDAPARVTAVWASSLFDIEARCRYPGRTRGRHATLIDDGSPPHPEKLVADMDRHIEAMAKLLGQPVPDMEFFWVRGTIFGFSGRAMCLWAICWNYSLSGEKPGDLSYVDRHEVAHTLITALSGPDQYPPPLFTEGWAESQSRNRNEQVRELARARREGRTYSLQELVEPAAYNQEGPLWAYSEGGPLVHYLMHRYGPATFLRLYAGVRPDTFYDDCRAILGDSWETVEDGFWKWLEAEDKLLARADPKPAAASLPGVQLAKSVNPADWQTLVDGCREADKAFERFPSNVAFTATSRVERIKKSPKGSGSDSRTEWGFSAVFEGRQFWMFGNSFLGSGDSQCLLMSTPTRNADLTRDKTGAVRGQGRNASPRDGMTVRFVTDWQRLGSVSESLPIGRDLRVQEICRIERLLRPTEATGKWKIWFTQSYGKGDPGIHYQIEVAPACHWRVTRSVLENKGEWRTECTSDYKECGDGLLAVTGSSRSTGKDGEMTRRAQLRPMSEAERQELKRKVEQTAEQWAPMDPHPWPRRGLWAIVIGCPLGGVVLLVATRRRLAAC
jgi:hypothetical protein